MMPRIYIRDQNDEVLDTLDEGQYFDDNMQRFLKGKATVLSFTIVKTEESYALMTAGRNLSFRFDEEDFWLSCVIVEQDETYLTVTAWSLGLELNNETHGPYKAPKAMTFAEYLAVIDIERILTIGINEVSDKKISHEWEGTESKLARLYSLATVFSAEIAFDTELNEDGSLKQISLNVYREHSDADQGLGQDRRNETFYFGEDIKTIRKTEDTSDLYTAIFATGKDGLTIAGIEKEVFDEDGNLLFATYKTQKPGFGDPRKLYAPQARDQFPSNTTGGDRWTLNTAGEFEYESAEALLGYMMSELKKNCQPATTWEIEGYIKAKIGDTVRIADEGYKPTLFLEARVIEQEISFSDKTKNKSTFSNVVELESQVDSSLLDRVQKLIEANKTYQYSISTDNGIVFKNNTGTTTLTATVRDGVADVAANFEITWFKDGTAVGSGVSLTVRATDVAEKAVYRFEASKADGTVVGGYEVTVTDVNDGLPGADGEQGPQGEPGPPGADGQDGLPGKDGLGIVATQIMYAGSDSGTVAPSTGWMATIPTLSAGKYLWTQTTWVYSDNTGESGYSVSRIGKDGNTGKDGVAGKDGVGLVSTVITYAKSTSGTVTPTTGWTTAIPSVPAGQFLWTKSLWAYTDGTTETGYSVAKMGDTGPAGKDGIDGVAGKDGVGLKSTAIQYAQSTSGTTAPTSGWTTNVPTLVKGQHLWTKTVWTYTDNSNETGYTVSYNAKDGNTGKDGIAGKDGVGISNTVIEYVGAVSGTSKPTSGWSTTIPTVPQGQYLWTRTTWTYSDGTKEQGYSAALMGPKGDKGDTGDNGQTPVVHPAWSWSADGTDRFTTVYPGENLIRNSTFENGMTGWTGTSYWTTNTATKLNEHSSVRGSFASASDSAKALRQTLTLGDLAVGDDIVWSVWAKSDTPNSKIHLEIWGSVYSTDATIGTEWTRVSLSGKLGAVFAVFVWNITPGTFWVSETKLERGATTTIHTPAPSEDYTNAYPKYRGEYTDTIEADSTDPSKYTWTAYLGEQGPPTGVISQSTVPSSPYVGMLWQNTGNVSGYISNATYRWNGSAWEIYQFTAQNILAETFTGFVFRGVEFIGSRFVNEWTDSQAGNTGRMQIADGELTSDYWLTGSGDENNTSGGHFSISRDGILTSTWKNETVNQSRGYVLTDQFLEFFYNGRSDLNGSGRLTARQLTQVPWTNLPYESGFTTAENNPCQYRVVYLLDGSRELQMRGQVQNTAGTALPTATSPYIGLLPATARPVRNELVAAADSSRKGARVAVLKNGYIQIDTPNANTTYVSLGGIRILLE